MYTLSKIDCRFCDIFSRYKIFTAKIKSISLPTQQIYIYYVELHISAYLRSMSVSQLAFKAYLWKEDTLRNVYFFLNTS